LLEPKRTASLRRLYDVFAASVRGLADTDTDAAAGDGDGDGGGGGGGNGNGDGGSTRVTYRLPQAARAAVAAAAADSKPRDDTVGDVDDDVDDDDDDDYDDDDDDTGFETIVDIDSALRGAPKQSHLGCFGSGLLALAAAHLPNNGKRAAAIDARIARRSAAQCAAAAFATATGLPPERWALSDKDGHVVATSARGPYLLRPEIAEAFFYQVRACVCVRVYACARLFVRACLTV
jgi:hypothetical protein